MTQTDKDLETLIKDAWLDGYDEGYDEGYQDAHGGRYTSLGRCWERSDTYKSLMTKDKVKP